jgi:hypothetical protein
MIPAAVVSGCGSEDEAVNPVCAYLPDPAIPRVDRGPMTPERALRKCEADDRTAQAYLAQGFEIAATTETYGGEIIDWMTAESVPGSDKPPPPPIAIDEVRLPPGVQLGRTELEMYPELQGPVDTVGVSRMTFSAYVSGETGASSLEEYLEKSAVQPGLPSVQNRLYAGYQLRAHSKANVAMVNAFTGPPIQQDTFSLMEMAVGCAGSNPSTTAQLIGMVASRDTINFKYDATDAQQLRLQVEFYTEGDDVADDKGGWHGKDAKFVANGFVERAGSFARPGMLMQGSVVGGPQYEHRFEIQLFNGDWCAGV